ncbi:MAG: nickel pincer cofactor biosynthesis protein LarC [Acidobacteria bacterium]|nr:nickel pincer cofactor biosynthesis protein LarC [Acidobacteriota bacterium]
MTTIYFDCFAGAAGDMILGALIDAGVPMAHVQEALGSLGVDGVSVELDRVLKTGVTAAKFRVRDLRPTTGHGHAHYHLKHIHAAIDRSALSPAARTRALQMFRRLAEAEAAIHGTTMERVHLHEVGALDSIIDIVGTAAAMEWLAPSQVVVSPVNVGSGTVQTAHGLFPVPGPATVRLMQGLPTYSSGAPMETLTPTGALILTEYATGTGAMPAMTVTATGYGAGDRDLPSTPNVVRVFVGQAAPAEGPVPATGGDRVCVLTCEIDDLNPQILGALMDRLLAAGALDVSYTAVQMKKNRPGTRVTIVAAPAQQPTLARLLFRESSTLGIRVQELTRLALERRVEPVGTPYGVVRFKVAHDAEGVVNAQPEFDDLARLAADRDVPIKQVQAAAHKAWLDRTGEQ